MIPGSKSISNNIMTLYEKIKINNNTIIYSINMNYDISDDVL